MARYKGGKIGSVIGAHWHGINYMKSLSGGVVVVV